MRMCGCVGVRMCRCVGVCKGVCKGTYNVCGWVCT